MVDKAEIYLDNQFPKGNKKRGEAIVLLAIAQQQERERILKIIKQHNCYTWIDVNNKKKIPCVYIKELENKIKEEKNEKKRKQKQSKA